MIGSLFRRASKNEICPRASQEMTDKDLRLFLLAELKAPRTFLDLGKMAAREKDAVETLRMTEDVFLYRAQNRVLVKAWKPNRFAKWATVGLRRHWSPFPLFG